MSEANPVTTPTETTALRKNREETADVPYRELVGSLMHLAVATRPDLSYAVSTLSKFLENPSKEHWSAGKRVLKYLAGTVDVGLTFCRDSSNELVAYSDADFAACVDSRKSISGVVLMLNDGPVVWSSRKQTVVATSTTDAEYVAAHDAAKEIAWIRRLLADIGCEQVEPTTLFCDNQAAEKLVENPVYHQRTKHIDVKFHYTRDLVKKGEIEVVHVCSALQRADMFTKPLTRLKFEHNRKLLNVGGVGRVGVLELRAPDA